MKTDPALLDLIEKAKQKVATMPLEERNRMLRQQAEGVARAEASWPKPKYHFENGVKVYESYEDYCND